MRKLSEWSSRSVTILLATWVVVSGTALTAWILAAARGFERAFAEAGPSLGATAVEIDVDLLGAWPQLLVLYAAIVVLPAVAFWLLWRRTQRAQRAVVIASTRK